MTQQLPLPLQFLQGLMGGSQVPAPPQLPLPNFLSGPMQQVAQSAPRPADIGQFLQGRGEQLAQEAGPLVQSMGQGQRPGIGDLLGSLDALGGAAGRIATSQPFDPSRAGTDFTRDLGRVGNELLGFPSALSGAYDAYQRNIGQPFAEWATGPLANYFSGRSDQPQVPTAEANQPRFIAGLGGQPQGGAGAGAQEAALPAPPPPPQVDAEQAKRATGGNVPIFWNILSQEGGFAPHQVAGVIGRLQQESGQGLNTRAEGDKIDGKPTSFGAAQWHKERFTALKDFAQQQGTEWTDTETQARFILHEMNTTEKFAGDLLRAASTPEEAAEAMMHYERPQGYTRDNPRAGHGWDNTVRNAQVAYGAMGVAAPAAGVQASAGAGMSLPPFPPTIQAPPERPTQAPPDYSGMNQWLDQAQPTPPDMEALSAATNSATMAGMLQGLAGVNMGQRGNFGQGFAAAGAGAMAGLGQGQLAEAQAQAQHERAMQNYALERAGVSGDQAMQLYRHEGLMNETQYQNAMDVYNTGNVNLQNTHDWQTQVFALGQKARDDMQPQALWTGKEGAIFMNPDGTIQTIASGLGDNATPADFLKKEADVIKTLTDALGQDHPLVQDRTAALAAQTQNVQLAKRQVVEQLVRNGTAATIFPEEFAAAQQMAKDQVENMTPGIMGDPQAHMAAINTHTAAILSARLEAHGDDWWIEPGAALGNPLAMRLLQGGRREDPSTAQGTQ